MVCRHSYRGNVKYSRDDIDFLAAFVAPHDAWYIIPIEALGRRFSIRLYPDGKTNAPADTSSPTAKPGTC